jgi:AraC family transcriptional regulator
MTTSQLPSTETPPVHLDPPAFKDGDAMLIAGLQGHFSNDTMGQIPTQWMHFIPHIGHIAGQVGRIAYGVCSLSPNGVDYLSGVQVSNSTGLPADFNVVSIPAQRYAVFAHHGHVSKLGETCDAIEHQWLPRSGYHHPHNSPNFFERYGEGFDPKTGTGDIEVWVSVS